MKTIQEMIAVMQAFADGEIIEYSIKADKLEDWIIAENPFWDWLRIDYRVKEEPKQPEYIPFTFEDAEFLIGRIVKCKTQDYTAMIFSCALSGTNVDDWRPLLDDFIFLDGSPCGKLKQ